MRDTEDDLTAAYADATAEESDRAMATLIAGGLLGAALGAGLGLLASRAAGAAAAEPPPPPAAWPRRAVARSRDELDDYARRIERELRALRRLVTRQRRRGWLR
jgi:hypothetical protein